MFAKDLFRKSLDRPVLVQHANCANLADSGYSWVTIRAIADQRKQVWNETWADAKLFTYRGFISNRFGPTVDLHNPISVYALAEIFVRRPDAYFQNPRVGGSQVGGGGKRIIGF